MDSNGRFAVGATLFAAVALGAAVVIAALNTPEQEMPLPPPTPAQGFTSLEDLREFARTAYADLSRGDWASLGRSFTPGGAERLRGPCEPKDLGARAEAWEASLEAEAGLRPSPLHEQLVELPRLEWSVADIDAGEGAAWITRRAGAFGRAIEPPVLRRDRWVVVGDAWWLDPAALLGDPEASGVPSLAALPECEVGPPEPPPGAFDNPLPDEASVDTALENGQPLTITVTALWRGDGPPAPSGFEYASFQAQVESADGSQLGAPLTFRSATFDGWFLGGLIATGTSICPGTESTGVTCQLTSGRALVAAGDPAPKIAWTQGQSPDERASGTLWWRLPPLQRDGAPVVRPAVSAQALVDAGIDERQWETDFSRLTIDLAEVRAAGAAPRTASALVLGGIEESPGVYDTLETADSWLGDTEPVLAVEAGGEARAYPLRFLLWHPAVNDVLGGEHVLVTYSPPTNTALAFSRRVGMWAPEFHPVGASRFQNFLLYDDITESWRQQGTGEAVAGELAGHRLTPLPALLISWGDFRQAWPEGTALSINAGFAGEYDFNPHFDTDFNPPSALHGGELDRRLPAHARVLGLRAGEETVAVPFTELGRTGVAQFEFGGQPVVVFWREGTASALSHIDVAQGRDVGAAAAFAPLTGERRLAFTAEGGVFIDAETGSTWDITGRAVEGPLSGERLRSLPQTNSYWFSWAALHPATEIWGGF